MTPDNAVGVHLFLFLEMRMAGWSPCLDVRWAASMPPLRGRTSRQCLGACHLLPCVSGPGGRGGDRWIVSPQCNDDSLLPGCLGCSASGHGTAQEPQGEGEGGIFGEGSGSGEQYEEACNKFRQGACWQVLPSYRVFETPVACASDKVEVKIVRQYLNMFQGDLSPCLVVVGFYWSGKELFCHTLHKWQLSL